MREIPATSRLRQTPTTAGRFTGTARAALIGALALLVAAATLAFGPSTALADHDGTYVVCPDPVSEGNSTRMGIRRSGYKVLWAIATTDHVNYTADADDFTEYHGVKFEQSQGNTLWIPIETSEDSEPEHDETFAVGFMGDGIFHHCVITIADDDSPTITGVSVISAPVDRWAYRAGEAIDVVVMLDQKVDVEGTPLLSMFFGSGDDSVWRGARYRQGSGTRELVFRYVVQTEDLDRDGLSVAIASTTEDRTPAQGFIGSIYAAGTDVPIKYDHSGVEPHWRQRVDGRPYVQSNRIISTPEAAGGAYRANEVIEVAFTFDTPVVVQGDACATLYVGYDGHHSEGTAREAAYRRGSGTDTLVFGYRVQPGDTDPRGIMVALGTDSTGFCGSGTIRAEGTGIDRNPWYLGKGPDPGHKVDTTPPAVTVAAITSTPVDGEAYTAGETITVEVDFSEDVAVSGTPYLELDIGDTARRAAADTTGKASSRLVLTYEVQQGDTDTDGVGIDANSLRLDGGSIYDAAGNTADLAHPAIAADTGQRVAA